MAKSVYVSAVHDVSEGAHDKRPVVEALAFCYGQGSEGWRMCQL